MKHKYVFVIGGVMSGVGKGIATASIGKLLKARGFKVNLVKADPYLNVDAGNMNPTEHGEVFILKNGLETDQDMGNYERFLNTDSVGSDYMTSGMVYQAVIARERALGYGGKCVEAIPHVRDEIIARFAKSAEESASDITVVEIGGTVGDYQNSMFMEAARVMAARNKGDVCFIMVSYLPVPGSIGEMKTKPTQNAIRQLNSYGIQPDIILARGPMALDERRKEKIAISCTVKPENVISAPDVSSIYDVPLNFERDKLSQVILTELGIDCDTKPDLAEWEAFAKRAHNGHERVKIAVVGKYFDTGDFVLSDAYLSVIEAIKYSGYYFEVKPELEWIDSKQFETGAKKLEYLSQFQGVVVPGGFGTSGIEGILMAIQYARENKIPYLGLCYGMQLMAIEFARNVAKLPDAHTVEVKPDAQSPIVDVMPDQKAKIANKQYGGTMRLGAYPAKLKEGSIVAEAYGTTEVSERHRHRYEINPAFIPQLEAAGLVFSGVSPLDDRIMEFAELPRDVHPYMVGTQAHPELQARPLAPHPLFTAFMKASINRKIA
ncbi:MAG: synthetase, synthase [Candidatus Parcubacteria bacterium]